MKVFKNNGAVVVGLGNRRGIRGQLTNVGRSSNHGGARYRNEAKQREELQSVWWHPDVRPMMAVKVEASLDRQKREELEQMDEDAMYKKLEVIDHGDDEEEEATTEE